MLRFPEHCEEFSGLDPGYSALGVRIPSRQLIANWKAPNAFASGCVNRIA